MTNQTNKLTLRFLATGETFQSLSYSTRIAQCTISKFVPAVLNAICVALLGKYLKVNLDCNKLVQLQDLNNLLKVPATKKQWEAIAQDFYNQWQIPNVIGAMDGKHIVFRPPKSAGSHYYNYKGTHSIVLLALVDANYSFIYINVGTNGRVSNGGVYDDCDFSIALNQTTLNIPDDKPLPGMLIPVPHVILADAAFPLQRHMKPYHIRNMTAEQRIFNSRLSRGRRVVENAFGILANRFRVLLQPINLSRDKVVLITQACCALHNFLKQEDPQFIFKEVVYKMVN